MAELVEIRAGVVFDRPAAESWKRMEQEAGRHLDVNRSTVSRETQLKMYKDWANYAKGVGPKPNHGRAIHPDSSWHCLPRARACDTDDHRWIRNHPEYGWRFVVPDEVWHAQYYPEHDKFLGKEVNDMGTLDRTEENYQTFAYFAQRFLQYDGRPNGVGADWKLGPTIWERLNQIEFSAKAGAVIEFTGEDAKLIAESIPVDLADKVITALKNRL